VSASRIKLVVTLFASYIRPQLRPFYKNLPVHEKLHKNNLPSGNKLLILYRNSFLPITYTNLVCPIRYEYFYLIDVQDNT
jgi:hypothetical protein